jgi:hypothetical protein
VSFVIRDGQDQQVAGGFGSVEGAKASLPQVYEWRQDSSRPMGWNGWLADPATGVPMSFSKPDYKITWEEDH